MSGFIPTVPDFELQLAGLAGLPSRSATAPWTR